jgi:hypothetical protein
VAPKRPILECVTGDARRVERRIWMQWLQRAAEMTGRFSREWWDDDPFAYNETASVSLLAAAAGQAGYLGLAEFTTTKGKVDKSRPHKRRVNARGRCDYWMHAERRDWAFEFKQIIAPARPKRGPGKSRPVGYPITEDRLAATMEAALDCAKDVRYWLAPYRVAGLIVSLYWLEGDDHRAAHKCLRNYAEDHCDFAWSISHCEGADPSTFLLFKFHQPGAPRRR